MVVLKNIEILQVWDLNLTELMQMMIGYVIHNDCMRQKGIECKYGKKSQEKKKRKQLLITYSFCNHSNFP